MSRESEVERELTDHEIDLLLDLVSANEVVRMAEETARKVKDQLAASMDGFTHGLVDGTHVVTISRSRPERFDIKRFRAENEVTAKAYTVSAEADVVRVLPRPAATLLDRPTHD
jgi:hypothetical protein